MYKLSILLLLMAFAISCKTKPHISFKLKADKVADGCNGISGAFRMESNFAGERFEWEACLPAGQEKDALKLERKGDTVVVHTLPPGTNPARYNITLDVDVYPAYHFITVGDNTYIIAAAKN